MLRPTFFISKLKIFRTSREGDEQSDSHKEWEKKPTRHNAEEMKHQRRLLRHKTSSTTRNPRASMPPWRTPKDPFRIHAEAGPKLRFSQHCPSAGPHASGRCRSVSEKTAQAPRATGSASAAGNPSPFPHERATLGKPLCHSGSRTRHHPPSSHMASAAPPVISASLRPLSARPSRGSSGTLSSVSVRLLPPIWPSVISLT